MTNLKQRLKELREISEKATPGEWYVAEVFDGPMQANRQFIRSKEKTERSDIDHGIAEAFGGCGPRPKDAAFIAASRTAFPQLLLVMEELVRGLEAVLLEAEPDDAGPAGMCACVARETLSRAEALLTGGKGNG